VHRQGWKRVIPAVTSTPDGELWNVSLTLTNRSKNPGRVNISFAGQSAEIALLPGERRTIDDALALFALAGDAAGAVVIETGAAGIELEARANKSDDDARSQSLPFTAWDALLSGSNKRTIILRDLRATEDIRVIISNLGDVSTTVTAHVRDARGQVIAREILPLAAGSSGRIDLTGIIRSHGGAASLVELTSETLESRVFGYLTTTNRATRAPLVRIAQ
jgi:hypothetical protein